MYKYENTKLYLNLSQTSVENIHYQQVLPISQLSDSSPIQFIVKGQNAMGYIDTKNSFFSIKANIILGNGTAITSTDGVGPVNLSAHALF